MFGTKFLFALAIAAVFSAGVDALSVLTLVHNDPGLDPCWPILWEGTSWLTLISFFWVPWVMAWWCPPGIRPRILLLLHVPGAFVFSLLHVGGFVLVRRCAYALLGSRYDFGSFWANFPYEARKSSIAYVLSVVGIAVLREFVRTHPSSPSHATAPQDTPVPTTFDIRDGANLTRIVLADVLAITAAGNYAEFVLRDGRRPMMRTSLSALETALKPQGFIRTHRSWLVNPACMTGLRALGSGNYAVDLDDMSVPLSRRFPAALAQLRGFGGGSGG